jgi:16S rRNA (guanine527-N7)-methyltransferase
MSAGLKQDRFEQDGDKRGLGAIQSRLNEFLAKAGQESVDSLLGKRFEDYLSLLLRWNARINLTAIRDQDGILARHFVESIVCARALPAGIGTLLDLGSGAGFPGIPIALCRPEIAVTLAESQGKKAAFLQEAVRVLALRAKVHSGRAESLLEEFVEYDCVVLRGVDRMSHAVKVASQLVRSGGWLGLMTTVDAWEGLSAATGEEFSWRTAVEFPGSESRVLAIGVRQNSG